MTIRREEATAEALAKALAAALKPGPHGTPIIEDWDGAAFTVRGSESGECYRVSVCSGGWVGGGTTGMSGNENSSSGPGKRDT